MCSVLRVGIFADFMLTMVEVFDGYLQAPLSKVASVTGSPNYLSVKNVKRTLPFSPMRHRKVLRVSRLPFSR